MKSIIEFQKLHIRTQRIMYFFPVLFVYLFLLPYHYQLLVNKDEITMIKVFDSAQKFLLMFGIWFQYLGFRLILSTELKELSYSNTSNTKSGWCLSNIILTLLLFFPYAVCLALKIGNYCSNIPILFMQCIVIGGMTYFFMHLLKSALGGMALVFGYYFLSISHFLPKELCIIRLGLLPVNFGHNWYIIQLLFGTLFFVGGVLLEKIKHIQF